MTGKPAHRPRLSRSEQRYNYLVAAGAVAAIIGATLVPARIVVAGVDVPVFLAIILVAAFLFGLGQMVIGITRRRRFLAGLPPEDTPDRDR